MASPSNVSMYKFVHYTPNIGLKLVMENNACEHTHCRGGGGGGGEMGGVSCAASGLCERYSVQRSLKRAATGPRAPNYDDYLFIYRSSSVGDFQVGCNFFPLPVPAGSASRSAASAAKFCFKYTVWHKHCSVTGRFTVFFEPNCTEVKHVS